MTKTNWTGDKNNEASVLYFYEQFIEKNIFQ